MDGEAMLSLGEIHLSAGTQECDGTYRYLLTPREIHGKA